MQARNVGIKAEDIVTDVDEQKFRAKTVEETREYETGNTNSIRGRGYFGYASNMHSNRSRI
jgi:hypothetical protein